MGTVSLTLPSDGQTIDASDVNNPLNTLAAEINGQLDNSNIKSGAAIDRSKIAGFTDGWESLGYAPTTITALGNRSYTVLIPSVDTTTATSPGQRLKLPRTVTAPTYMGGAFNGSSHYFTKVTPTGTLSTVTNNFTLMAHVEPTAYTQAIMACRVDAAANNGPFLRQESDGRVSLGVINTAGANYRIVTTYQSLPLNKKTHVAASWTSGTVVIYFDGKSVPVGAATTGGTAPTVSGTGGDFAIGRLGASSGQYWTGYISSVGFFDAVLSGATILQHMNQALTGSETNCIGAWNLNNAATDASAAANNLTATGGVGYTARSPYTNSVTGTSVTAGTTNYGIIMAQTFSTNTTYTIQIPEGETLPTTGGIGTVSYSTQKTPYGFPGDAGKWVLETRINSSITSQNLSTNVWSIFLSGLTLGIYLPAGAWRHGYKGSVQWSAGGVASLSGHIALTTSAPANSAYSEQVSNNDYDASTQYLSGPQYSSGAVSLAAATQYNLYTTYDQGTATVTCSIRGDLGLFTIFADNAYL